MKIKHLFLTLGILVQSVGLMQAADVKVTMNTVSTTMSLSPKGSEDSVPVGEPATRVYTFTADPGAYTLTAYGTDGTTVNGTIDITVNDSEEVQEFTVFTITAYATNSGWTYADDYTIETIVDTREGKRQNITLGNSTTAGRKTFLVLNGNSYNVAFIPSEEHQAEGYTTGYRGGAVTANVTASCAIPLSGEFTVSLPAEAEFQLGMKFTHFTDFTPVAPISQSTENGLKTYTYKLANSQVYNYRTWKAGGLTHAGYFTMNTDTEKCPVISFTDADYAKHDPKAVNHDVQSNNGYETGGIFVNINPQGHLKLNVGESFNAHAMRTWELTDNSTNNYFMEPDFHYTIVDLDGKPSSDVITVDEKAGSAWATIKAVDQGTAIVLVTYDGINVNYYQNADKKDYLGGEYWGAIWPENTAAYVVTVGGGESAAVPNMVINEAYNEDAKKNAGKYVDAEHDVFYYLDTEAGFNYTFTPENVVNVEIAYPTIGEQAASYTGFASEGVTANADGSYTVLLKQGRQIVKLTDNSGNATYQVLTAKPCHRDITNATREGSTIFQPGDKVKIQYSGLFHPANKLAGIYNMSAYVTYNGTPNGSSLILGSGQYTFGSAVSAQAVTVDIPEDYDVTENPQFIMNEGVIQVNGFGDPIGNHRVIDPVAGRSPNFTAISHKTYFGAIPDIAIPLTPVHNFIIKLKSSVEDANITLLYNGEKEITADENGVYAGTYGSYSIIAKRAGYRCFRHTFELGESDELEQTFDIAMVAGTEGIWDGETITAVEADEEGIYHITNGAEMAYFSQAVAEYGSNFTATVVLDNDIDLGDYDWTPIGANKTEFAGMFDGQGHTVTGLYVNNPELDYAGLFGSMKSASSSTYTAIKNVTVNGFVAGRQYTAGVVGKADRNASIEKCANMATVEGTGSVGGIVGYLSSSTNCSVTDAYNHGDITGSSNVGGVVGYNNASAVIANIYSIGEVTGAAASTGACVGSTTSKTNVTNAFSTKQYELADSSTLVTDEQMASGEIAYKLGEAFGQTIGADSYPVFDGMKVYYDELADRYYNIADSFAIDLGEGNDNVEVTEDGLVMRINETYRLDIIANPIGSQLPEISWSTTDEKVVSIDENGVLTANGMGTATIKVELADNPDVYATCQIVVTGSSKVGVIFGGNANHITVYDLNGKLLLCNASAKDLKNLKPGLYVVREGCMEKTVLIK